MKKIYAFLFTLLLASGAAAQNPTAYFMEGSTLRSQFNPAFAPLRGYVNIPGLGGLDINVSGNLSIDKILYPRNGKLVTLLDSSVSTADALSGLKADNLLGLDTRVNLIGFGAFTRNHKNFWSFDLNARVTTDATLPYSLFDFLKRGNSGDISDIGITADSYLEAGFNYSFPLLDDKLYIGVRAKFLMGVARARMYFTQFNVSHNEERWLINAAGGLDITAAGLDVKTELNDHGEEVYKMDDISLKPTSPAGYGFAVDFGATYDILPNLQASLAVNDLGFIGWSKNKNVTGYSAKELSFTGVTVTEDGTESPDFDIDVLEFHKGAAKSVSRMLRASINAGLEYEVWRHKIGIGLLYTARVWEYKTLHNITGSVNFHPIRWFTVTGSYSVIDNRGGAVGLALNLNPSWINFYLATDIVTAKHTPQFIPIKQSVMNVTLGIGVPIGRRSHRIAAYVYDKDRPVVYGPRVGIQDPAQHHRVGQFPPDPLVYRHGQLFGDRQPRRRRGAGAEPEPQLDQFLPCHGHRHGQAYAPVHPHQAERDERHAGHRRTDRQAQPPYRGLCVRQGSAVNERETRPFQAGFFLSGRPKILPNRA